MEIFFDDPKDIPVPREQVRIRELNAQPYPDGQRIRVYLEVTPFQVKPDAEISLENALGELIASASVIETINPKMEMTLHAPAGAGPGDYTLKAIVQYRIEIPSEKSVEEEQPVTTETLVVDHGEVNITIP